MSPFPELFRTPRMIVRRPTTADAETIFTRYASDPEITRYVAWPRHASVADTATFLRFADEAWSRTGAGPWLATDPSGRVLGSTGIDATDPRRPSTGYVLAKDAWGRGLASELLAAVQRVAASSGLPCLTACVHPDNVASIRVLEKAGFARLPSACAGAVFPNLEGSPRVPVLDYAWTPSSTEAPVASE